MDEQQDPFETVMGTSRGTGLPQPEPEPAPQPPPMWWDWPVWHPELRAWLQAAYERGLTRLAVRDAFDEGRGYVVEVSDLLDRRNVGEIPVRLELEVSPDARSMLLEHWPPACRDSPQADSATIAGRLV